MHRSKDMRGKRFRFKNAWLTEPFCKVLVKDSWEANDGPDIVQKVKHCGDNLNLWGKKITGCFSKRIRDCKEKMKHLRNRSDAQSLQEYKEAKQRLIFILNQKEIFWRQRSKHLWLQAGDKNIKYFHAACNSRQRTNRIQKLKNDDGVWVDWQSGIQSLILNFYRGLFVAGSTDIEEVIRCVPQMISQDQNMALAQEVTKEEVHFALFQMHPDKAPGPDGMTPAFYQKHWDIIGEDVFNMTRHFFSSGEILEGLNDTNIVLIPKKKNPTQVGYLRPIALCNVLMKVITKVLANRMKILLTNVVSDTQSAFVLGRLISDNIMVSYDKCII